MPNEEFYVDGLSFVWDEDKNRRNMLKHGISFQTAAYVFLDNLRLEQMDQAHSTLEEIRYITIGMVHDILTVVYCERSDDSDSVIRLISARHATEQEIRLYNNTMFGRYY